MAVMMGKEIRNVKHGGKKRSGGQGRHVTLVRRIETGNELPARTEVVDRFVVKEPAFVRPDSRSLVKQTFEIPARAEAISVQIHGRFQGSASLCDLRLERKK